MITVAAGIVLAATFYVEHHVLSCTPVAGPPDPTLAESGISRLSHCRTPLGGRVIDFYLDHPSRCTWREWAEGRGVELNPLTGEVNFPQPLPVTETFSAPAGHVHKSMYPHNESVGYDVSCRPST